MRGFCWQCQPAHDQVFDREARDGAFVQQVLLIQPLTCLSIANVIFFQPIRSWCDRASHSAPLQAMKWSRLLRQVQCHILVSVHSGTIGAHVKIVNCLGLFFCNKSTILLFLQKQKCAVIEIIAGLRLLSWCDKMPAMSWFTLAPIEMSHTCTSTWKQKSKNWLANKCS